MANGMFAVLQQHLGLMDIAGQCEQRATAGVVLLRKELSCLHLHIAWHCLPRVSSKEKPLVASKSGDDRHGSRLLSGSRGIMGRLCALRLRRQRTSCLMIEQPEVLSSKATTMKTFVYELW